MAPKQSPPPAQWVDPSTLQPWAANPRRRDDATIDKVAASITEFGFAAPIVARAATREIIAGHARWQAAQRLGLALVPVRFIDLTEAQAHKLALADNKLYELSEWDPTKLHALLSELQPTELPALGWSDHELKRLNREVAAIRLAGEPEEPAVEVPAETVSKLGDVWQLGRHTLVCADCRGWAPPRKFDLVLTDPPYGISVVTKDGFVGAAGSHFGKRSKFGKLAKPPTYPQVHGDEAVPDVRWIPERATRAIIWGGQYFADQLPANGCWFVWDKRVDSGIVNSFADCELAWTNLTGQARVHHQLWNGLMREGEHTKRIHPTQKPVALMRFCLDACPGDVFDPYAGSGSVLIACEEMGRTCYAVEISPAYCDAIVHRWQTLTGAQATRITGATVEVAQ